jgi:hypothetical protein
MDLCCLVSPSVHRSDKSSLFVFEEESLPFSVLRTFLVTADGGEVRGEHAHRECSQLLVAASGKIHVTVFNGFVSREFLLENSEQGLIIPPLHWATQKYVKNDSTLLVLCDRTFDEADYIRSFEEFRRLSVGSGP